MRLENLKLVGFRRFEQETCLQLTGKLVAITGPNEAGKTSVLKALEYLSRTGPIEPEDKSNFFDGSTSITASYFLEQDELEIAGLDRPTWLHYTKLFDGKVNYRLEPWATRDVTRRRICKSAISQLRRSKSAKALLAQNGFTIEDAAFSEVLGLLDKEEKYTAKQIKVIQDFSNALPKLGNEITAPEYLKALEASLDNLVDFENEHDPSKAAYEKLKHLRPKIVMFGPEDRDLALPYDIRLKNHQTPASRVNPSKPLAEIIRLSGLDLDTLIQAQASGNSAGVTGLISAANETLREISAGVWTQSDACLYFRLDGPILDLLVENKIGFEPSNRFSKLKSRSDGYRQFVALHVFTLIKTENPAILLIDEVEQHLHYDAQADLIQHLQNETGIKKVIYTTHSAGALPEDLGTGIRLIRWDDEDAKKSIVINKFWTHDGGTGFRPLLFGMGAATFAFFPTRRALITEGATELLILPLLMRQSIGTDNLGFQVVHGLSNMRPKGLPDLGCDETNIAYLTDNDAAGKALKKMLTEAGADDRKIFSIGECGPFTTIEDLIEPGVWKSMVNRYIDQFGASRGIDSHITKAPQRGRIAALPDSIKREKISFAYNLLDMVSENPSLRVLSDRAAEGLSRLTRQIRGKLSVE